MKFFLLACFLGFAAGSTLKWFPNQRIVNGHDIDIEDTPYQVAIGNGSAIWCGGSIISNKFILTAAHCFEDHDINNEQFAAFVGMTSTNNISSSMFKPAVKVTIHPNYDQNTHNYDLAIVELVDSLSYNNKVQPISMPSFQQSTPIGSTGFASGWGKLSENGPSPAQLQGVALDILSTSDCSSYSNFDEVYMLCAGSLDGSVDTCQGDSGGPLVQDGLLWGITSYGHGCARPDFPGVYANVANLRNYIREVTGV